MKKLLMIFFLLSAIAVQAQVGYNVGDVAADFSLKNIDDKMMSLSDMEDAKGFVVVFTCNHCPYSKLYEDRIVAIDKKYKAKGFPVIAINPNDPETYPEDSFDNMKKRAKNKGFTFPYLWDETQDIARTYGAERTPHVYLLNKVDGKLKVAYIGAIDDNARNQDDVEDRFLENAIDALLSGKKIDEPYTRAIGCTIKWSDS
ncbi:MAG: thioredoxin family protein [Bacteroidota bacterium]